MLPQQEKKLQPKKRQKNRELPLGGVLVVDKPAGLSSHDIVGRLKLLLDIPRIGHAGTLDPFATGVLLVCVGRATRLVPWLTKVDKEYRAELCFGASSTTEDTEGTITEVPGELPTPQALEQVLTHFRGTIRQRPPRFSAVRVEGRRAYKIARGGREVEMPEREVEVTDLAVEDMRLNDHGLVNAATLRIACGSGTYIRSLARDIGAALGTGAYLTALRRTRVGAYTLEEATPMVRPKGEDDGALLASRIQPAGLVRIAGPSLHLDAIESRRFLQGQRLAGRTEEETESIAVRDPEGHVLGFGAIRGEVLHPLVVLG